MTSREYAIIQSQMGSHSASQTLQITHQAIDAINHSHYVSAHQIWRPNNHRDREDLTQHKILFGIFIFILIRKYWEFSNIKSL